MYIVRHVQRNNDGSFFQLANTVENAYRGRLSFNCVAATLVLQFLSLSEKKGELRNF